MAQPDTTKTPGAKAANGAVIPTVWELYRDLATTMLAGATDPGAWPSGMPSPPSSCAAPLPSGAVAPNFQPIILNMVSKFSNFPSETEQATNNPLVDQAGWYVTFDVRLDQSEYTYIRQFQYYNAANQIAAYTFRRAPGSNRFREAARRAISIRRCQRMPSMERWRSKRHGGCSIPRRTFFLVTTLK